MYFETTNILFYVFRSADIRLAEGAFERIRNAVKNLLEWANEIQKIHRDHFIETIFFMVDL